MNGLGILITGGFGVLLVLAVKYIVIPAIDRPEGRHTGNWDGGEEDTGWGARPPEIASEPPAEFLPQFYPAPAAAQADTPTAAEAQPPALAPPPVIHHDEYAPAQRWHPQPVALPPDPARLVLAFVIAALAAHLEQQEAAFQTEAMSVWTIGEPFTDWLSGDTIARGFPAIRVDGDMDAPLSAPREWLAELEDAP